MNPHHPTPEDLASDRATKAKSLIARGVQNLLRFPGLQTQRRVFISATTEPRSFTILELQDNLTKAGFDVVNPVELRDLGASSMQVWERLRKLILTCDYFITFADAHAGQEPRDGVPPTSALVNSLQGAAKLRPTSICQWEFATAMASAQTVGLPKMFVYRTRSRDRSGTIPVRPLEPPAADVPAPSASQRQFLGFLDDLRSLTAGDWTENIGNSALEAVLQEEDLSSGGRLFGSDDRLDRRWQEFHEEVWEPSRKVLLCCDAKQDVADTVNLAEYIEGPHYSPVTLLLPENPVQARVHPLQEIRDIACGQFALLSLAADLDSGVKEAGILHESVLSGRSEVLGVDAPRQPFTPVPLLSAHESEALDAFRRDPLKTLALSLELVATSGSRPVTGTTWPAPQDIEAIVAKAAHLLDGLPSRRPPAEPERSAHPGSHGDNSTRAEFEAAGRAFDEAFELSRAIATPETTGERATRAIPPALPGSLSHLAACPLIQAALAEQHRLQDLIPPRFLEAFELLAGAEKHFSLASQRWSQLLKYESDLSGVIESTSSLLPYRAATEVFASAVSAEIAIFLFANPDPLNDSFENRQPGADLPVAADHAIPSNEESITSEIRIPSIHAELLKQLLARLLPAGSPAACDCLVITARGLEERIRLRMNDLFAEPEKRKNLEAWISRLRDLRERNTPAVKGTGTASPVSRLQWHDSAPRRLMIPKALGMLLRARQWRIPEAPDPIAGLSRELVRCLSRDPSESLQRNLTRHAGDSHRSREHLARRTSLVNLGSALLVIGTAAAFLLMFSHPEAGAMRALLPGIPLTLGAILASAGLLSRPTDVRADLPGPEINRP